MFVKFTWQAHTPAARRDTATTKLRRHSARDDAQRVSEKICQPVPNGKKKKILLAQIQSIHLPQPVSSVSPSLSTSDIHWSVVAVAVVVLFFIYFALSLIQMRDDGDLADVHERKTGGDGERERGGKRKRK